MLLLLLLPTFGLGAAPGKCVHPAICTPPQSAFSAVAHVQSRSQWPESDGYCGSLSVQAIAMSHGNWISQDQVRRAAPPSTMAGCSGGDATTGYELDTSNIGATLRTLRLAFEIYAPAPAPPAPAPPAPAPPALLAPPAPVHAYLSWLKRHLARQQPVVWFVLCKGDSHSAACDGWDHIEPVWGIYSNRSLADHPEAYPDDVIVHGADYGAAGAVEAPRLYRAMASLPDTAAMEGNCAAAQPGLGLNEYYPCLSETADFGCAVVGNADEVAGEVVGEVAGAAAVATVGLSLAVDSFAEPDLRATPPAPPAAMGATVTVGAGTHPNATLLPGAGYVIYRWDGYRNLPARPDMYSASNYTSKHAFVSRGSGVYVWRDPAAVWSGGTTHYRCVVA